MNTVQEQWDYFASMVVPKDAPDIQRTEMKRAFYAGAEAMMRINFAVGVDEISVEAGMQIFVGCEEECRRFAQLVADGKA